MTETTANTSEQFPGGVNSPTGTPENQLLTDAGINPVATENLQNLLDTGAELVPPAPIAEAGALGLGGDLFPEISSTVIVDGTLWTLIGFSVLTWAILLIKGLQLLRIGYSSRRYNKRFWRAPDFNAAANIAGSGPAARLAHVGFSTLIETEGGASTHDLEHTGDRQELLERRLRQQVQKERGYLESGLAILATVGSISPFVGLFGTVWGIMGALTSISKSGSASLDVVAGPIGEALVATAVGIAVAVPAVVAYNFFLRRNKVILARLDDFAIDFIHLALKTSFIIRVPKAEGVTAKAAESSPKKPVVVKTANYDPSTKETLIAKGAPA